MEKSDQGSHESELDASPDVEVTEQMGDKQKPEDQDNELQAQIAAEVKVEKSNEESEDVPEYETGEIQPKVEKCKESKKEAQKKRKMQVTTEPPEMGYEGRSPEPGTSQMAEAEVTRWTLENVVEEVMKYHPIKPSDEFLAWMKEQQDIIVAKQKASDKCKKPGSSQIEEIAEPEETSEPSNITNAKLTLAKMKDEVMKYHPSGNKEHREYLERLKKQYLADAEDKKVEIADPNKQPEAENIEECEQPQQELHVQHAERSMKLVLEEAVICDATQERVEEVENIEEPKKYAFREPSSE